MTNDSNNTYDNDNKNDGNEKTGNKNTSRIAMTTMNMTISINNIQ